MNKELNIIEAVNMPAGTEFEMFSKSGIKETQKVIVSEVFGSRKLIWEDGKDVRAYGCTINARFVSTQQNPVSFMEAVKSGKRIRASSPEYELIDFCTIGDVTHNLSLMSEEYMRKVILNGKWYIED